MVYHNSISTTISFAAKYYEYENQGCNNCYSYLLKISQINMIMGLDNSSVITAILYYTLEKTKLTLKDINDNFDSRIVELVYNMTKLSKMNCSIYYINQTKTINNLLELLLVMRDDIRIRILLIKFISLFYNVSIIGSMGSQQIKQFITNKIMKIYIPLVDRIGLEQIKIGLQDFCFNILNPIFKLSIVNYIRSILNIQDNIINRMSDELYHTLNKSSIVVIVSSRIKTPYSIWVKMQNKNVNIRNISDIIAFRVIVDSIDECYKVFYIIQGRYEIVPGTFQDFINVPKKNGYQSIHVIIISSLKQNIEIQIRTHKMHNQAEYGNAAHWKYKCNLI